MGWLTDDERAQLQPAESALPRLPIPVQAVSSDEFMPLPQSPRQRELEKRLQAMGAQLARHQGLSRRQFFRTASGMAAAFLAMNDTFGPVFGVSPAEAATPELAQARASALSGQFIMDMHTHFLRDDTRLAGFVRARESVGKAGWNPMLVDKPQTLEDLKFANYMKEVFLDSDTKVACISGAPSEVAEDAWQQFEQSGRIDWVSDLAEIPSRHGVSNVYADVGQLFAQTTIAEPKLAAALMGLLIRGMGADHVCWGTDAIWTGAPQWQIEALRRLEIPDDLQRRHGFAPLGAADGPVKQAILGDNNARLYKFDARQRTALSDDRLAQAKQAYERDGSMRTNLAYGFVAGRG